LYDDRSPDADSPWAIPNDGNPEEVARTYRKFMTNRLAIAKCLMSKKNLSALGLDGIGYLFLKLGEVPQIESNSETFQRMCQGDGCPRNVEEVANGINSRLAGVFGMIWNDHYVTMTRCGDNCVAPELIVLRSFVVLVSLYPDGATLMFQTHSKWLVAEWDKRVQWIVFTE
jgi:hypothetical protein